MRSEVNRAEQLWKNWEEKEKALQDIVGEAMGSNPTMQKLKYEYLQQGVYRLSVQPSEKEKLYLHVIRSVTAKLEKQLYPNTVLRLLHKLKAWAYNRPMHLRHFEKQKSENLELLKSNFKTMGFASFTGKLENYLDYERQQVTIPMTTQLADKGSMEISLKLEGDQAGQYRISSYQASLYREGELQRSYTFPAESRISATEAANLLEGRPVSKSYPTADASINEKWVQFDFKGSEPRLMEFHAAYGYNLKKELITVANSLGVDGLGRDKIVKDLEAGNLVAMQIPGKGQYYLHANPAERSVNIFDAGKKPVDLTELGKELSAANATVARPEIKLHKVQEHNQVKDQSLGIG